MLKRIRHPPRKVFDFQTFKTINVVNVIIDIFQRRLHNGREFVRWDLSYGKEGHYRHKTGVRDKFRRLVFPFVIFPDARDESVYFVEIIRFVLKFYKVFEQEFVLYGNKIYIVLAHIVSAVRTDYR